MGRPPEPVPPEQIEAICEWIAGGQTLRDYCRQEGAPAWRTVYLWLDKDKDFAARFAHARELGEDAIAAEALEIIDTFPANIVSDSGSRLDAAHVTWLKNRADMRLKLLAKWNPKKWGERTTLAGDPDAPLVEPMDDSQRAAKMKAILAAAKSRKGGNG